MTDLPPDPTDPAEIDRIITQAEAEFRQRVENAPRPEPLRFPPGFPTVVDGPRERARRAAEARQREVDRVARAKEYGALPAVPFQISVVGVSFRDATFIDAVGLTWLKLQTGQEFPDAIGAQLVRQPDNEHDTNAIAVWLQLDTMADQVGFVPRALAARLAPEMDAGDMWVARLVDFGEGKNPLIPTITIEVQRQEPEPWMGLEE